MLGVGRRLLIIGRGATAEKLAELGGQLGYDELAFVEELVGDAYGPDDHVVIAEEDVTRARAVLLRAARADVLPAYLGYAAPHREGWKALVALAARDVPRARIDAISAPAGVDVGAETPEEVAIAVAAELVALRRGRARPSAGLDPTATPRRAAVEARPRRLIGRFARTREPELDDKNDDVDDDDDGEGRN
jgi:xanthine dehydrogenase accessory factor